MRRRFVTLDVFTDRRFAGNPLAVVFEADGLESAAMQAVAREFNYPETVFVLPASGPDSDASIRIFTPAVELPFAGHPTVGAAVALALADGRSSRTLVLAEKIGLIRCAIELRNDDGGYARFEIPKLPEQNTAAAGHETIATALGLDAGDIAFDGFAPARWSAGVPFTFVPVGGIEAVRRCRIDPAQWDAAFETGGRTAAYVFTRETADPQNTIHARMFAPRLGIAEDPATGSAAAAFAGLYVQATRPADGEHMVRIEQGYEMGRPSLIEAILTVRDGRLVAAAIGGSAVLISEGTIQT